MTFIKKLWIKTKFYSDLITESFLVNLWAAAIAGALLVFGSPFIGMALSIVACVAVATLALGLNFWIWSNPMDMSRKLWNIQLSSRDTVEVVLKSFEPQKGHSKKVKKINQVLSQRKIDFLNQFDYSGHTVLTALALDAHQYATLAADPKRKTKEKKRFQKKADDCIYAIAIILQNTPVENRIDLIRKFDQDGNNNLWLIMTGLTSSNPELLDAVLKNLSPAERTALIAEPRHVANTNQNFKNELHYAVFHAAQQPRMVALLSSMLHRLVHKTDILSQTNARGYTIIEEAVEANRADIFAIILPYLPDATALIKGDNALNINLFQLAAQSGCTDIINHILGLPKCITPDNIYEQLAKVVDNEDRTVLKSMAFGDNLFSADKNAYADMAHLISMLLARLTEEQRTALILTPHPASDLTLLEESIVMLRPLSAQALFNSLAPEHRPTLEQLRNSIQNPREAAPQFARMQPEALDSRAEELLNGLFSQVATVVTPIVSVKAPKTEKGAPKEVAKKNKKPKKGKKPKKK